MNVEGLIKTVEANLVEVQGQISEGGNALEAVRQLRESVELLEETIERG